VGNEFLAGNEISFFTTGWIHPQPKSYAKSYRQAWRDLSILNGRKKDIDKQ
jgi:hypothetical protein